MPYDSGFAFVRDAAAHRAAMTEHDMQSETTPALPPVVEIEIRKLIRSDPSADGYVALNGRRYRPAKVTGAREFATDLEAFRLYRVSSVETAS